MALSRKERLRKRERFEQRQARRTRRSAAEQHELDQQADLLRALPEEEQQVLVGLCAIASNLPGKQKTIRYPTPKMFKYWGITDLDQKRVIYLLWFLGLFEGECDESIKRAFGKVYWIQISGVCEAIGLGPESSHFLKVLEALDVPGLKYTCEFAGELEERERIPFAFNFEVEAQPSEGPSQEQLT
jgi:hypothetical protein